MCLDVGKQPLQRRTLQRGARNAAVVIAVRDQDPALGALAGNIGLAGLALGIEAIEFLLQPLLAGFAGVDRAAEFSRDRTGVFMAGPAVFEAEEDQAVPARAGNRAGDGRERLVGTALIFEVVLPDRHAVLDALPFADQPGAGDRAVLARLRRLGVPPSSSSAMASRRSIVSWLKPAIGQFLDAVGKPVLEEAAVIGRRFAVEEIAPFLLECGDGRSLQGRQLRQNRISHPSLRANGLG